MGRVCPRKRRTCLSADFQLLTARIRILERGFTLWSGRKIAETILFSGFQAARSSCRTSNDPVGHQRHFGCLPRAARSKRAQMANLAEGKRVVLVYAGTGRTLLWRRK